MTNRRLLFGLHSKALHQIQQQFAGHGLNADWQRVVMNVTGEDVDGHGEVGEGEEGSDVVDQVCQNTVRQGSVCMEREREIEREREREILYLNIDIMTAVQAVFTFKYCMYNELKESR